VTRKSLGLWVAHHYVSANKKIGLQVNAEEASVCMSPITRMEDGCYIIIVSTSLRSVLVLKYWRMTA
jgi:hypothetical protein